MCLDSLNTGESFLSDCEMVEPGVYVGYKDFGWSCGGEYESYIYLPLILWRNLPPNKWLHEYKHRHLGYLFSKYIDGFEFKYPFGWHIYLDRKCSTKVLFKKVVAEGYQVDDTRVVVAKKMKIIEETNR